MGGLPQRRLCKEVYSLVNELRVDASARPLSSRALLSDHKDALALRALQQAGAGRRRRVQACIDTAFEDLFVE